jgi:DNA-binding CsgD family transcriptional regulator/PAS domain-containing protein
VPPGEANGDARPGKALSPDDLARLAADVLSASPFPALVLEVPSERIVAAGRLASLLLDPSGEPVVDHLLEEFTADRPMLGTDLLAGGRLNGFEAFRVLRRAHSADLKVRMWVRTFEHQPPSRLVLVILAADQLPDADHQVERQEAAAVVGTAGVDLRVERISEDAQDLFGVPVAELVGTSLTELVTEPDVSTWVTAVETASAEQHGVTVTIDVEVIGDDGAAHAVACDVLILPLHPGPSWAFVLLPIRMSRSADHTPESIAAMLTRLGRGAEIAQLARGVFSGATERDVPGLGKLTTRELEIVSRLLEGDRAPTIASRLFLTQSTVRNHLAAVFAKLGVNSQQQLLDLFRRDRSEDDEPGASTANQAS